MELERDKQVLNADWCHELVPGAPYFSVFYFEPALNIPEIRTLVYLGLGKYDDGNPAYFFQAAESFWSVGDWSLLEAAQRKEISAESVVTFSSDAVGGLADIDGLLVLIGGLAKRMKLGIGWDRILPDDQ
jgi:hypothetical protein